jgi:hypothetical protein
MKPSRKSLLLSLLVWLVTVAIGYWCSCNSAFGQIDGCGECFQCGEYFQIYKDGGFFLGWKDASLVSWTAQGFNGFGCGRNGNLWYAYSAACYESSVCVGPTGSQISGYSFSNADTCNVSNAGANDIIEADNGQNPQKQGGTPFAQYGCNSIGS